MRKTNPFEVIGSPVSRSFFALSNKDRRISKFAKVSEFGFWIITPRLIFGVVMVILE